MNDDAWPTSSGSAQLALKLWWRCNYISYSTVCLSDKTAHKRMIIKLDKKKRATELTLHAWWFDQPVNRLATIPAQSLVESTVDILVLWSALSDSDPIDLRL